MIVLKDRCFVVTGASRGIGAGIVRGLATAGARVAMTYSSSAEAAQKVFSELPGQGHLLVQMNVADGASVDAGFAQIHKEFSTIAGLVNNAGITRDQLLMRMKDEDFDAVMNTNLRGAFLCSRAVMRPMLKARGGSIVNISSVVGQMGNGGQANYAASKAGLEGFTRSLAKEVASRGVRVNAVAPGFIATDMTDRLDDKQKESILSGVPLERLGSVEDVANAVAFLLSDMSLYITGHVLQVNGGLYM
jgi:3-oxoacyl-[acyl-carrier protein] reductase